MTLPVKEVIPREISQNVQPIITWFGDILDEVVNFGSHIMIWDMHPKTTGEENIPPTMLLRHLLDIIDSVSILVRQGTGDTTKILSRAGLETGLYLEYLFENNTYNRAMAFLVEDTIRQIKTVKKIHPKTPEGKEMHKIFKDEELLSNLQMTDTRELDDFLATKQKMLELLQFKKAYAEYQRMKKEDKSEPKWYRLYNGPRTIEALAKHLKQKTLYEIIYRKWSGSVHGTDIYLGKINKTEDENRIDIVQLRFIKDVQESVSYCLIISLKVFRIFLQNRCPEKLEEYARWYLTIKDAFKKITGKNYIVVE